MTVLEKLLRGLSVERTPDGRRVVVSRRVAASPETTWSLLADTHRWPEWGPSVAGVACESRCIQVGSRGRVRTVGGLELPFEITACDGARWTWRVAGLPATGHRVEAVEHSSRVTFEVPPPAVAYAPVCRRALDRIEDLAARAERESDR